MKAGLRRPFAQPRWSVRLFVSVNTIRTHMRHLYTKAWRAPPRTSDRSGLFADTRRPALAGRGLLLEDGGAGLVGVVGAEREFSAGVVLGALHVEFHADSPVGVASE